MPATPQRRIDLRRDALLKQLRQQMVPDKHVDRIAWNDHMERQIALRYEPYCFSLYPAPVNDQPHESMTAQVQAAANINNARITRELLHQEEQLIGTAVENLIFGSFEKDWVAVDEKKKKEILLEGLYRAACEEATNPSVRVFCPELTVEGLAGEGKYNLLELLKRAIAHDPRGNYSLETVFIYQHPFYEHQFRLSESPHEAVRILTWQQHLLRTSYIVDTLRGVLDAYVYQLVSFRDNNVTNLQQHNRPAREIHMSHPSEPRTSETTREDFDTLHLEQVKASAKYSCSGCRGVAGRKRNLQRCSGCQAVWYCSSECQKKHWKDHKKVCCKASFDPTNYNPSVFGPVSFIGCPSPSPDFQRPPALFRQIQALGRPDSYTQDYHFETVYGFETNSIRVTDLKDKLEFLVARRRAMTSGSPSAVYRMFQILQTISCLTAVVSIEAIRRQLEREYRVCLDPTPNEIYSPATPNELDEELEFSRQRYYSRTKG
ncbi:hypothetical protein C8J56DRAFT_939011 [Mycena floridula]|nr:hypothetical protein C8J56DRAFT_939011 [Mycena floridula]